jgi:glycosyltransferase involved in cell wall biosynthesis
VARRIERTYGITASVVYPPIDVGRFRPARDRTPEEWFLVVSRLVPHKWIDRAVRASNDTGFPLRIIGEGRALPDLKRLAGPNVEFLGALPDPVVVDHMQRCRAFILPGIEDFGMTAVEAQAAGRPVIAARGGGALETVHEGETGLFFDPEDETSLPNAMRAIFSGSWEQDAIIANAARFETKRFLAEMDREIELALATRYVPGVAGSSMPRP